MKANMDWVTDLLATGGDLAHHADHAAAQAKDIIDQGVDLVIDVRQEANDAALWHALGMSYLHLPTDDREGHHIPTALFDKAVKAASSFMDHGQKVLVHCHMGINRGPSVAYAILLSQGMDPIEAFDLVREKRPVSAVLYAQDALFAHFEREGDLDRAKNGKDFVRLVRHMESIWTPEERARIQRIIRDNHREDSKAYTAAVIAGALRKA